jgi:hypothetical protein
MVYLEQRSKIMKKKQKLFLGFVVLIITAIITLAGCELFLGPTFPSEFRGNWITDTLPITLIIKEDIITDSSINYSWELINISGDDYDLKVVDGTATVKIHMELANGILTISGNGDRFWAADWRKK